MRLVHSSTLLFVAFAYLHAQGSSSPAGTAPASSGGGGGSLAVEGQMIGYEALNQISHQIASDLARRCDTSPNILLGNQPNLSGIAAYLAFKSAADQLASAYQNLSPAGPPLHANGFPDVTTAVAGALATLKGSTTMSSSTFQQVDQALISDLEADIKVPRTLVVIAYPQNISDAYANKIQRLMQRVYDARTDAINRGVPTGDKSPFQGVEAFLASLQKSLSDASSNSTLPNILLGAALLQKLGDNYCVLTLATDAVGGGSRANTYFFVNLFVPAPHPSYNGGAVVSYTLRDQAGLFKAAHTYRFVFGYSKWKQPPMRNKGQANFTWTDQDQLQGHWSGRY